MPHNTYSPYLTDYTAPEKRQFAVRIANKDDDELKIRLRLRIEGKGATLITKPSLNPTPLFLPGNGELNLSGDDIDEYFNVDNLDVEGLDVNPQSTSFLTGSAEIFVCNELIKQKKSLLLSHGRR